jgi:hypothetical protein
MVVAHVGRALLIGVVPLAYVLGRLSVGLLVGAAFTVGLLSAVFNILYVSYLPSLVNRSQLVRANVRLEATYTISDIGGRGVGGLLVQAFAAPLALVFDAFTYVVAAGLASRIAHRPAPANEPGRGPAWPTIMAGVALITRHPILRPIVLQSVCYNLFAGAVNALFLLFGTRSLGLSPGALGAIMAIGSAGGLAGALVARRAAEWLGAGRAMTLAMALCPAALALVPAASGPMSRAGAMLAAGLVVNGFGLAIFNVHSLSVRALIIPSSRLPTVTGSFQTLSNGVLPVSGVLAAALGSAVGVRYAIAACVAALGVGAVTFLLSPVRLFDANQVPDTGRPSTEQP